MSVLVISGTGTGVGKTVTTAGIAALALARGERVAVVKPAQTGVEAGQPGDLAEVSVLAGRVTTRELRRYPDPLSPEAAARRSGLEPVRPGEVARAVSELDATHDLTLVEGAGGLLVRFDSDGSTLADIAWALSAPLLVVAAAGLGTLNATALTAEVATARGIDVLGVVIGSWPRTPDLAAHSNVLDFPEVAGAPLAGALPEGVGALSAAEFLPVARAGLSPWFGGDFDPERFAGQAAAHC